MKEYEVEVESLFVDSFEVDGLDEYHPTNLYPLLAVAVSETDFE